MVGGAATSLASHPLSFYVDIGGLRAFVGTFGVSGYHAPCNAENLTSNEILRDIGKKPEVLELYARRAESGFKQWKRKKQQNGWSRKKTEEAWAAS